MASLRHIKAASKFLSCTSVTVLSAAWCLISWLGSERLFLGGGQKGISLEVADGHLRHSRRWRYRDGSNGETDEAMEETEAWEASVLQPEGWRV